jgi:hypothetical protein
VHNIFKKNGLDCPQKRMRRIKPIGSIFDPKSCNTFLEYGLQKKVYNECTIKSTGHPQQLPTLKVSFFTTKEY